MDTPEPKNPTEALDVQRRMAETEAGHLPVDERTYPYFPPAYHVPFVHIGTDKQLFLDNFMLDHLYDVERVIPTPQRPDQAVLTLDNLPWEFLAEGVSNLMPIAAIHDPDDGKFKMWYMHSLVGDPFSEGQVLCYAESTDGLHWAKPLSADCLPYENHKATNIVHRDTAHVAIVLNHDRSDPSRKYLMLYNPLEKAKAKGRRFVSTVDASPDGIRWTNISEDTDQRHHHTPRIIWDDAIQKWVAYGQYSHHWNFLHRKRQIGRQESADFIHWSPKEVVLSVDNDPTLPPHLEFHEMSARKVGGLYIGTAAQFLSEPVWNIRNNTNWRDVAHVNLSLYVSRDGRQWTRAHGPEPWVDNRQPGSIDYGHCSFTVPGYLVHDGQMFIYHDALSEKQHWYGDGYPPPTPLVPEDVFRQGKAERDRLKRMLPKYPLQKRSIGALILREDGWAELKPAYEHGMVLTRQFVFEGDTLRVNADAYGGYVQVEALDAEFKPYAGFAADDCDPVFSDHAQQIWHTVRWRGNADVRALWNKPVRLRFHLHQASLYAFQFVYGEQRA